MFTKNKVDITTMAVYLLYALLLTVLTPGLAMPPWLRDAKSPSVHGPPFVKPDSTSAQTAQTPLLSLAPEVPRPHLPPGLLRRLSSADSWLEARDLVPVRGAFGRWLAAWQERLGGCGVPRVAVRLSHYRVLGGEDAWPGAWPWMAALHLDGIRDVLCAGSLIAEQWVVTAAHCFLGPFTLDKWAVHLGVHNVSKNKTEPENEEQAFRIAKLYVHPEFRGRSASPRLPHDIALVKLDRPARVSQRVWPLCLPSPDRDVGTGEVCKITGWGIAQISPQGGLMPTVLQQAAVPVWGREDCQARSRYPPGLLPDSAVCAGPLQGGVDSCNSDSGGPLQCLRENKWTLQGVTSWGGLPNSTCGQPGLPGVYTHVTSHLDWLLWHVFLDQYF